MFKGLCWKVLIMFFRVHLPSIRKTHSIFPITPFGQGDLSGCLLGIMISTSTKWLCQQQSCHLCSSLPVEGKLVERLCRVGSCPEKGSNSVWIIAPSPNIWQSFSTLKGSQKPVSCLWESACREWGSEKPLPPVTEPGKEMFKVEIFWDLWFNPQEYWLHIARWTIWNLLWVAGVKCVLFDKPALRHNLRIIDPLIIWILGKYQIFIQLFSTLHLYLQCFHVIGTMKVLWFKFQELPARTCRFSLT